MRNPVQQYLERIVEICDSTDGEVAAYIPELAAAAPDRFALCLATVDGKVYEVGTDEDRAAVYSIQSISKPFTYALALHDLGIERVMAKVGVEPSGEAFNQISVEPDTGRPFNPMINAGAIATSSLVGGAKGEERFDRALEWFGRFAGRDLGVEEGVFTSELDSAHRNRAIAHMLREFEVLESDPEDTLTQYVRQCSIGVTTRDLAIMAATLANGGSNPCTGKEVLDTALGEHVLSVMLTCGMYDAAGDWATAVGMPAKSGVSGGIIGVLPGQVGVAVFSPRLDPHGNSLRGVSLFERMSRDMEMHVMHVGRGARSALRRSYTLGDHRSPIRRMRREQHVLDEFGGRAHVYELHGDVFFAGAESVTRKVVEDEPELALFDLSRVTDIADVSKTTFVALRDRLTEIGSVAIVVDPDGVLPDPDADNEKATRYFEDLPEALEWAEEEMLRRHGEDLDEHDAVSDHPLVGGLPQEAAAVVREVMTERSVPEGEVVLEAGTEFAGIHVVVDGRAVARRRSADGQMLPVMTFVPGTSFGELSLGTDDVQETEIVAMSDLDLLVLSREDLERITDEQPRIGLQIWRAIARDGYRMADRALRRTT